VQLSAFSRSFPQFGRSIWQLSRETCSSPGEGCGCASCSSGTEAERLVWEGPNLPPPSEGKCNPDKEVKLRGIIVEALGWSLTSQDAADADCMKACQENWAKLQLETAKVRAYDCGRCKQWIFGWFKCDKNVTVVGPPIKCTIIARPPLFLAGKRIYIAYARVAVPRRKAKITCKCPSVYYYGPF